MQKKQFMMVWCAVLKIMYKNNVLPEPHGPIGRCWSSFLYPSAPAYTV